ncbi:MAG: hydantoinase/oxoprolinase N-terminal domain-containing protein, partial [Actinomycetota bacterium]|nr:hydantoinase/oxoprolinase N-terminal domain-containing protein [Actinomycetota bacterium]
MTGTRTPLLGVDTGGTYTDAVIYDEMTQSVLGSAKAETTHDDLAVGIDKAIADAIDAAA